MKKANKEMKMKIIFLMICLKNKIKISFKKRTDFNKIKTIQKKSLNHLKFTLQQELIHKFNNL